ncbi:sulfate transporter CysZ [Tatumella citrea]|uniref:Sulfate transporter CysZ n=1 Tax=Tatumella citrea TaxID=53336 RepID=A0A1Y0LAZ6_TATCI|nr:sulfate transporter CysZ [Tatumella citrea]ARU94829.1 sulfate transporter CysZ [Tatumella citrea]ARU98867.1 sulfate transporter CysZ [Tatumella citrea]
MQNRNSAKEVNGIHYFRQGWQLATLPGIRRYVIVPLLVNIVLMGAAFSWLFFRLEQWIPRLLGHIPHWLQWLDYLLWPLAILSLLLIFGYFFSTLANWIAAPFCGLLAEQLESRLTGHPLADGGWKGLIKDLPRIMLREWQKLKYYLPRAIILLLIHFIPVVGQTLAPLLWFLFGAWMMAIQYCDYPFDNHRVPFLQMRRTLATHRTAHLQFGALVSIFTLVPLVNLVIMPVAVCGATAMWVDHYRSLKVTGNGPETSGVIAP